MRNTLFAAGLFVTTVILVLHHADGRSITKHNSFPQQFYNIFNMLSRPLFVTGIAMMIVGPLVGKGRLLKKLLQNRLFDIMSRL